MTIQGRFKMQIVAAALLASLPAIAGAGTNDATVGLNAEEEARAISFANALCSQVRTTSAGVSPEQFEASLVFALSQSQNSLAVQRAALARLPQTCSLSPTMSTGLRNALAALDRGSTTGTAGLGGGSNGSPVSNFTGPSINVGGGSVNYSSPAS